MAKINLGTYPFAGGVQVQDMSVYIGNNRFVRIATQRSNDSTIAVLYESSDVFNDAASINEITSEVILDGFCYNVYKLTTASNGDVIIFGKKYNTQETYLTRLNHDDVNGKFNIVSHTLLSTDGYVTSYTYSNLRTHMDLENDTLYILAGRSTQGVSLGRVVFDGTPSFELLESWPSTTIFDDNYAYSTSQHIEKVEDKLYFRTSSHVYGYNYIYDITAGSLLSDNTFSDFFKVVKLSETRYLSLFIDSNSNLSYVLTSNPPSYDDLRVSSSNRTSFIPQISFTSSIYNGAYCQLDAIALDEYHVMVFEKPRGTDADRNNIFVRVINILDENYAFVSDNSNGTDGHVLTTNYTTDNTRMIEFFNESLVRKIDTQRFYIQTDCNVFEFFTLTA